VICLTLCADADTLFAQTMKNRAKTIICLTYDDGLPSHLKTVIPQLDSFGFKATFFLNAIQGSSDQLGVPSPALIGWKKAAASGHELGNHTLFHPCPQRLGWNSDIAIESYTTARLIEEIRAADAMLKLIDNKQGPRSFAFPCNNTRVEGREYITALKETGLIWCAREGGDSTSLQTGKSIDPLKIPSWLVEEGTSLQSLIAFAERARTSGVMAVYQFHGIGGEFFKVSPDTHRAFLEYLENHKDDYMLLTISDAMKQSDSK
jgi:peptidoglycan-N-acetylglucosamine deacetylase